MGQRTKGQNTKKFDRYRQPAPCVVCKKNTTFDVGNTDLCRTCYDEAGLENEHSDYGHDTPHPGCPTCRDAG